MAEFEALDEKVGQWTARGNRYAEEKKREEDIRKRSNHFLSPQAGVQLGDLKTQLDGAIMVMLKLEKQKCDLEAKVEELEPIQQGIFVLPPSFYLLYGVG